MEDVMLQIQWDITEDLQDHHPYLRFGWWGFVPMVYENDFGTAEDDKKHMGCLKGK